MNPHICFIRFINIPWYETSDSAERDPTEKFCGKLCTIVHFYENYKCETSVQSDARLRKFFLNQAEIPESPINEI